jgi:hypothetical protein
MPFLQSAKGLYKMVFPRKRQNTDIENNTMHQHREPPLPRVQVNAYGRPELDPSDNLNLFRHLTGIVSHPSMVHSEPFFSSTAETRPAPNLGIYARVVHNEHKAKVGYRYFSWLINGCLGLQIVVAATLTALGASGGSRSSVTVFGAVNTVIAGILTFLKGSGLPNRFKYYETEWRRVREFIEQRERDFSRPTCDLDVYGVVAMVESMYDGVKMDLEASQPDRFAGHSSARKPVLPTEHAPTYKFPSMSLPRIEMTEKGKEIEAGFGSKVKNITSEISHFAQQAREAAKEFQDQGVHMKEGASREVKDYADRAERMEYLFGDKVTGLAAEIGQRAHNTEQAVHDAEARQHETIDGAMKEARDRLERLEAAARSALKRPVTVNILGSGSNVSRLGEN